jgi:hypothetical protein
VREGGPAPSSHSADAFLKRSPPRVVSPVIPPRSRDTRLPLLLSLGLRSASETAVRDLVTYLEAERPWAAAATAAAQGAAAAAADDS